MGAGGRPAPGASHGDRLVGIGVTDRVSIDEVIWPAFQRDSGARAELEYRQDVGTSRVLGQVRDLPAGQRPDIVILLNPHGFVAGGLADRAEAPVPDGYPPVWAAACGLLWPLYMEPIVAVYNARYVAAPAHWTELAAFAARNRTVLEEPWTMNSTGPALAELSGALDPVAWESLLSGMAATRPLLVGDNERVVLEVATGARWLGLSNLRFARRIRAGSPVRHVFLDPTPCIPAFGVLVRGARNPELGLRFLKWLASENGQHAFGTAGRVPCRPQVGVTAFETLAGRRVTPLFGEVDWVTDPLAWADRYRSMFAGRNASSERAGAAGVPRVAR